MCLTDKARFRVVIVPWGRDTSLSLIHHIFTGVRKIAKSDYYFRHVYLSVHPPAWNSAHWTENSSFIQI